MPFFDIKPTVSFVTFSIWLILFWEEPNFKKNKKQSQSVIVEKAGVQKKENKEITLKEFYKQIYSSLCDLVKESTWFIPHKTGLWLMPAKPDYLREKIGFNQEWTASVLLDNGIELRGRKIKKSKSKLSRENINED